MVGEEIRSVCQNNYRLKSTVVDDIRTKPKKKHMQNKYLHIHNLTSNEITFSFFNCLFIDSRKKIKQQMYQINLSSTQHIAFIH